MYYTVYKTTNQINGKFYIGTHKTCNLNDDYFGSGTLLKRAIEKYGIENFKKEILFVFNNPEDMYDKEAEIVTEEFLSEQNTYNLKVGGFGGWDYINSTVTDEDKITRAKAGYAAVPNLSKLGNCKIKELLETDPKFRQKFVEIGSKNGKTSFLGKTHTPETKAKIGKKNSGKVPWNSGMFWITNGIENRYIAPNQNIPEGFYKGRKLK